MNRFSRFALTLVLCLSFSLAPVAAEDRATGLARLVGVWQLDRGVSEDPMRMIRAGRGGGLGGNRSGGYSLLEERLKPYVDGAAVLTFAHEDPRLTITDWHDEERVLTVNGNEIREDGPRGPVVVEAAWKGSDRLVVKIQGDPAGKIVETYEIGGRGEKLFVTLELYRKGTRRAFSYERLYNRLEATD